MVAPDRTYQAIHSSKARFVTDFRGVNGNLSELAENQKVSVVLCVPIRLVGLCGYTGPTCLTCLNGFELRCCLTVKVTGKTVVALADTPETLGEWRSGRTWEKS